MREKNYGKDYSLAIYLLLLVVISLFLILKFSHYL